MATRTTKYSKLSSKVMLTGALILGTTTLGGCDSAGEGLFSGAALGALTGLALGSLSGNAGEGAVAGTIIGAAGGAVLGDINENNRENAIYGSRHRQSTYHHHSGHRPQHGHYDRPWWEEDWCD